MSGEAAGGESSGIRARPERADLRHQWGVSVGGGRGGPQRRFGRRAVLPAGKLGLGIPPPCVPGAVRAAQAFPGPGRRLQAAKCFFGGAFEFSHPVQRPALVHVQPQQGAVIPRSLGRSPLAGEDGHPLLGAPAGELVQREGRPDARDQRSGADCFGDLQSPFGCSKARLQQALGVEHEDGMIEQGFGMLSRRRSLLEQAQCILGQREGGGCALTAEVRSIDAPETREAVADGRGGGGVGVTGEPVVCLVCEHQGTVSVTGDLKRVDGPDV